MLLSFLCHRVHRNDDAALAVDDAAGHLLQVVSRQVADHLQIILVIIDAVAQVVVDDVVPIVIGNDGLAVLLRQIFLHL